ncbi:hypothetical protein [Mycobacterium sp. 3519A]|jgi:hypothetical protein|uniref:hypothetical protein n=1 Tax=Mycobacterium sp. 3519A TaxID=2057184 RepID=UPI000C7BC7EB|nr:hypothetical protein [Mycobacterium sp. 3519A]
MSIRKFTAGAVFAGAVAAAMVGAGTASAAPGISLDPGTDGAGTIGFGDQTEDGAYARATQDNAALAISFLSPSAAISTGKGTGNTAIAFNGKSTVGQDPQTTDSGALSIFAETEVDGTSNNVLTLAGKTTTAKHSSGNTVVNLAGVVEAGKQKKDEAGVLSLNVCGTQVAGQADHITVSQNAC